MEYKVMILDTAIQPSKTTFGQSTRCCVTFIHSGLLLAQMSLISDLQVTKAWGEV